MAKQPKLKRIRQNSNVLNELYNYVFLPMLRARPESVDWQDWLEYLWGIRSRFISRFTVKNPCSFHGRTSEDHSMPVKIDLRADTHIFVRVDADNSKWVDVELASGKGNKGDWYRVEKTAWRKVLPNLVHKPFRQRKQRQFTWDVTEFY